MKLLPVDDARARMLAEDVAAVRNQPPFPASAMDGWAVRAADTPGTLRIVGESAAGHGYDSTVAPGEAVRIFTGAAVPPGCDSIVIQEDATHDGETVTVPATKLGHHLRPEGGDFQAGQPLLTRGTRIDPWRLSLAAAAGRAELSVVRRPRIALFSTGEEIVEAPATPGPFQIYDSGSRALEALVTGWGAEVQRARPVKDELEATVYALRYAAGDLVVTVGGASVGDHDLVRAAAEALGLDLKIASVNVRPGKPTFFGVLPDGRRLLGLPGNPASALVCAELFLKPMVAAYQGAEPGPAMQQAKLAVALPANGPREHWMRAKLTFDGGQLTAQPYRDQDSSLVSVFAVADALLRRPAGAPAAEAGDVTDILPLPRA